MPSVDVVSKLDMQEVDNAVNAVKREIENRYDFRGSKTTVELVKGESAIKVATEDTMKLKAITDMLIGRVISRKLSPKILDFQKEEDATLGTLRQTVKLKEGLSTDDARAVVRIVKDTKLKVTTSNMGDHVRLSGNKIDDLQAVMQTLRESEEISVPLQFDNMKR